MPSEIKKLLLVLEQFRAMNPNMPIQQAQTFLYVCLHEADADGVNIKNIAEALDFSGASASRNVAAFTDWSRHRREGHDLLEVRENMMHRSHKLVMLNKNGERVRDTIEGILQT